MGLDYVDLYLAHWPSVAKSISREALENARAGPNSGPDEMGMLKENDKPVIDWEHTVSNIAKRKGKEGSFVPTWNAMKACVKDGKARAIGVSNFSIPEIEELLPHAQDIPVSCNQIEVHPWLPQTELINFAKKHGIVISCYSPFAGQKTDGATLLKDQQVTAIAKKHNMDVGQLLQSFAVQRGTIPLGKSATPARIKSNRDVRKLSNEDFNALSALEIPDGKGRSVDFTDAWEIPLFQN